MNQGYLSIVLHAHLPFVRHRQKDRIEELWLFEAISETYIPLLWNLEEQKNVKSLTISFSPPLMEMLSDSLMQRRYLQYIERNESLLEKETMRSNSDLELNIINFYKKRLQQIKNTFLEWDQNLLKGFRHYAQGGKLNCICSSATHAFLPYLQTKEGIKAQIRYGIENFKKHFGYKPRGFWLPECAYAPGIDRILFEEGIRYTFVDEHALRYADPIPSKQTGAPVFSPQGVILFPRDSTASSQVWSSVNGYPGDFDYREFYRDVAYERDWDYIKPYMYSTGIRHDTGLKYRRITGLTEAKEFYDRQKALNKAREHSRHFIGVIKKALNLNQAQSYPPYMIITPFDAELFGHWWFEGPNWLKYLIDESLKSQINLITPEDFIDRYYQDLETVHISFNTWGRNGYGEVWLSEKNSWIYRHLHRIEKDLISLITLYYRVETKLTIRCLKQMVREWLLVTSSDWPFIIDAGSASLYANNRIKEHIQRYDDLRELLITNQISHETLTSYEAEYPFLEEIDLNIFISKHDEYVIKEIKKRGTTQANKKILMLAWEFPPMIVGGLSRHVFDLSRALTKRGFEVHVITTFVDGCPEYEVMDFIHIHRVKSLQPQASEFYDWVGGINLAFSEHVLQLSRGIKFDVIHAHDWLVCVAAKTLKDQLKIPLVTTIHATEHGRNQGISTPLQQDIHQKEWELCFEADSIIVCSDYMEKEVLTLFKPPKEKLEIIPNGVDTEMVSSRESNSKERFYNLEEDIIIFSVGRIVKEKGFQSIIDAAPNILAKYKNVKFIIAGKGPLLEEYRAQVLEKGLGASIYFIGYINDDTRNEILNNCHICLFPSFYEPFGIVALESMAVGKPTIVSDVGGLGEIITHGMNGLKFYPNNIESLKTQVIACIENKKLAEEIAKGGKELVETKYSWDFIAEQTEKVYAKISALEVSCE